MEHPENITEIVNDIAVIADDLSEDETERQTMGYLHQLQRMTKDPITLGKQTAWRFRQTADTLDFLWINCKKAHIAVTSAGILGGALTIGGGIATVMSAGAATPLLLIGLGFGFAGAGTNIALSFIEAAVNSNEIKKAEKEWKETLDRLRNMERSLQEWMKKSGKLSLKIRRLVRRLTSNGVASFCAKAGVQLADKVLGATAKASAQAVDDVAGAGTKAGAKALGKVIIGVSAVFLVVDVIDLGFTINDLVEKKGSDAATFLRAKADPLDQICSVC